MTQNGNERTQNDTARMKHVNALQNKVKKYHLQKENQVHYHRDDS